MPVLAARRRRRPRAARSGSGSARPVRDRSALGLLGSPFVAVPLAGAALLVGAALAELYLKQWVDAGDDRGARGWRRSSGCAG